MVQQQIHDEEIVFKEGVKRFNSRVMRQNTSKEDLSATLCEAEYRLKSEHSRVMSIDVLERQMTRSNSLSAQPIIDL